MTAAEVARQHAQERQVRRAWLVLAGVSLAFAIVVAGIFAGARFYWGHATVPETATLQVISGDGALLRTPDDPSWRLATGTTVVREGDDISTALGTVVWLTMFDGSTVEVSEDTVVHVTRMRSSRFLKRTKLFVLEPQRGAVYVGMAPHGAFDYVEFTVRTSLADITMSDEEGRADAGSFLFEVLGDANGVAGAVRVRAAVLRGAAQLRAAGAEQRLTDGQQSIVAPDGAIGAVSSAVRELLQNGAFERGLDGWVTVQESGQRTGAAGGSVELVPEEVDGRDVTATEFLRGGEQADDNAQTGIRQRVGKTLRVYSSLLLQFDARITDQRPLGGGADLAAFPLVIKLIYVDIQGQEREWTHGYYIYADPARPVPAERGTWLDPNRWQHIAFDLRSLSPLPRQITAIVVYASGSAYQTRVANISLSSSELQGGQ